MEKIVVIGTGTMGIGIAAGFIGAGMEVVMLGRSVAKAQAALLAARKLAAGLAAGTPPTPACSIATIDGWDSMARAAAEIYPTLSNTPALAACVARLMAQGKTGMKAGAGFMDWPAEKAAVERAAYERRLKAAFDVLGLDALP